MAYKWIKQTTEKTKENQKSKWTKTKEITKSRNNGQINDQDTNKQKRKN